ncbi:DUF1731 domain-containing protein, partial [Salmonella enterica subsp. enterica serovar Minnesota]|uniref:DUF1731 domain-containing protein n=1 Tax=Salmonella enterica TaxID=28901 RepID=UPI003D2DC5AD
GFALKGLYGGMSKLVLEGQNAVPRRTQELGYTYRHPELDEALRSFAHADEVEIEWRSYELDPDAPLRRPGAYVERISRKYGI